VTVMSDSHAPVMHENTESRNEEGKQFKSMRGNWFGQEVSRTVGYHSKPKTKHILYYEGGLMNKSKRVSKHVVSDSTLACCIETK
jgi:hypothetical protein